MKEQHPQPLALYGTSVPANPQLEGVQFQHQHELGAYQRYEIPAYRNFQGQFPNTHITEVPVRSRRLASIPETEVPSPGHQDPVIAQQSEAASQTPVHSRANEPKADVVESELDASVDALNLSAGPKRGSRQSPSNDASSSNPVTQAAPWDREYPIQCEETRRRPVQHSGWGTSPLNVENKAQFASEEGPRSFSDARQELEPHRLEPFDLSSFAHHHLPPSSDDTSRRTSKKSARSRASRKKAVSSFQAILPDPHAEVSSLKYAQGKPRSVPSSDLQSWTERFSSVQDLNLPSRRHRSIAPSSTMSQYQAPQGSGFGFAPGSAYGQGGFASGSASYAAAGTNTFAGHVSPPPYLVPSSARNSCILTCCRAPLLSLLSMDTLLAPWPWPRLNHLTTLRHTSISWRLPRIPRWVWRSLAM